jgi:hypothetical protein
MHVRRIAGRTAFVAHEEFANSGIKLLAIRFTSWLEAQVDVFRKLVLRKDLPPSRALKAVNFDQPLPPVGLSDLGSLRPDARLAIGPPPDR